MPVVWLQGCKLIEQLCESLDLILFALALVKLDAQGSLKSRGPRHSGSACSPPLPCQRDSSGNSVFCAGASAGIVGSWSHGVWESRHAAIASAGAPRVADTNKLLAADHRCRDAQYPCRRQRSLLGRVHGGVQHAGRQRVHSFSTSALHYVRNSAIVLFAAFR